MNSPPRKPDERALVFQISAAVATSRARNRYVDCAVCRADNSEYLFHKVGVRFVRCRTCGLIYVSPVGDKVTNFLDLESLGERTDAREVRLYGENFGTFLDDLSVRFEQAEGRKPKGALLLGQYYKELVELPSSKRISLEIADVTADAFARLALDSDVSWLSKQFDSKPDLLILRGTLEACADARLVVERLAAMAPKSSWVVVVYSDTNSVPAKLLRNYWPKFFDLKIAFFNRDNLRALFAPLGYRPLAQFAYPVHHTADYVLSRVAAGSLPSRLVHSSPLANLSLSVRTGEHVSVFKPTSGLRKEKLSIILPCFNEEKTVAQVIETLLAKDLKLDKEIIIVESNSTDSTREVVRRYEGKPGVKVLYEERPQGKGHAVKTGLAAVTGTIVLIQDADFEYDIDDYDALLEPILQRRTSFVLGSRTLGGGDWKVRQFAGTPLKRTLLNVGQLVFAATFNALYQQRITDVNTMFKVFRTECLDGVTLVSNGFNLDIELACKIVKNGYSPMEVPVNYVARGFAEGKKISFVRDALPSYAAFVRYRFD